MSLHLRISHLACRMSLAAKGCAIFPESRVIESRFFRYIIFHADMIFVTTPTTRMIIHRHTPLILQQGK